MAHNAGKAASGAPDNNGVGGIQQVSSTFDADLAKANLLRLRAEYRKAEDICLSILKTYPNSAATHSLLGDINGDQGKLEQAAQWYELSLDLDPGSLPDQHKLDDMREQIKERDHISAMEQLGLPEPKQVPLKWVVVGVSAVVILILGLAAAFRVRGADVDTKPVVVKTPIKAAPSNVVANLPGLSTASIKPSTVLPTTNPSGDGPTTPAAFPKADDELKMEVAANSKYGERLLTLTQDLRSRVTTMTYSSVEGDDERTVAADLAKALFEASDDPKSAVLKAMKDDKLMYQAEAPRDLYVETLTDEWQQQHPDPDSWVAHVLKNEVWAKNDSDPATKSAPDGAGSAAPSTADTSAASTN